MREISADQVKKIIKQFNPHWKSGAIENEIRKFKKRRYFDLFFPLVTTKVKRAVVLMGPRRVGKTVLLWQTLQELLKKKNIKKKLLFLSLDAPLLSSFSLEELLDLYREIFSLKTLKGRVVIFDEIQYLKNWDIQLKVLVDNHPQTKFIASGSAAGALKRKGQESGAGRFTDFLLPPLTFFEYLELLGLSGSFFKFPKTGFSKTRKVKLKAKRIEGLNREFINYINYGGFPEAIFNKEIQKDPQRFIRSDIVDKVLLRDLPSLYGIRDTQELNRLFATLVYQTGNEISLEGLSRSSGVDKNTLKKYIEYLEAAFLIKTVKRVDFSSKRFKRENFFKVYLSNPSMYSAIYGSVPKEDTETLGSLVETAVFCQYPQPLYGNRVFYARGKGGKEEVDFVFLNERLKVFDALEVKWSDSHVYDPRKLKALVDFCHRNKLERGVTTTKRNLGIREIDNKTIAFIPAAYYCFLIGGFCIGGMISMPKDLYLLD